MEKIKKQRKIVRTQTTKLLGRMELIESSTDVIKLQVLKEQLEGKRKELKELDKNFLELTTDNEEEIEKDYDIAEEYQEKIIEAMKNIELKERAMSSKEVIQMIDQDKPHTVSARLPKIDLPTFQGDVDKWYSFWQIFDANIHQRKDLSTIEKLTYLLSLLRGEAARMVAGFSVTAENYTDVIEILKCEYGRQNRIIDLNVKRILEMKPVPSVTQLKELKEVITEVMVSLRNIKNLGVNIEQCSPILNAKIKQLVPADLLLLYERQNKEVNSTEDLIAFLQSEIRHRENVAPVLDPKAPVFKPQNYNPRRPFGPNPAFMPRTPLQKPNHMRQNCPSNRVSPTNAVKAVNCFKCGTPNHLAYQCRSR